MPRRKKQLEKTTDKAVELNKRNWKMTPEVIESLKQAFAIDSNVEEACFYAGISKDSYYRWTKADPNLSYEFDRLRNQPILKAKRTIIQSLDEPGNAFKFLERRRPEEWSPGVRVAGRIETEVLSKEQRSKLDRILDGELEAQIETNKSNQQTSDDSDGKGDDPRPPVSEQ